MIGSTCRTALAFSVFIRFSALSRARRTSPSRESARRPVVPSPDHSRHAENRDLARFDVADDGKLGAHGHELSRAGNVRFERQFITIDIENRADGDGPPKRKIVFGCVP